MAISASISTFAAEVPPSRIPASVEPGVISSGMQNRSAGVPQAAAPIKPAEESKAGALGPEAAKIKFKLTKIILEQNHVYTDKQIEAIYQDKLNKVITVAELQDIVQNITNYYRNNGYILSRAVIPPQHVTNGVVRIRVVEGYISQVHVIGKPMGARNLVLGYGKRIAASKPLQLRDMERYLILANEIPGVQTKAVLGPSKTETAASDLDLATTTKILSGFVSYDDYGTRYIGPQQITAGASANSILRSGDTTAITYVTTAKGNELQYKDLAHETPLGTSGLRWALDANKAITNPLYALQPIQIAGNATNYNTTLRYPVIRSRTQNLTLETMLNYLNSSVTELDQPLYTDRIRSIRFGGSYDFADRFRGSNLFNLNLVEGLPIFGGTVDSHSFTTSRFGATTRYTKITGQASRLQQLFWRLSVYGLVKGQYSFQPLLSSEQFAYGGSQIGRGYDPAEIIGDRGMAGSVELRLDAAPHFLFVSNVQLYAFYDAGEIWNLRNIEGSLTQASATSTGFGARFYMTKFVSGNLMWAQPLSRKVQSLQLIGNGSLPRGFFSVTVAV